jgi:hypothetical protein
VPDQSASVVGIVRPTYIGFRTNNISRLLSSGRLAREYILVKAIADP